MQLSHSRATSRAGKAHGRRHAARRSCAALGSWRAKWVGLSNDGVYMDFRRVVEQYHTAADEFSRGDPLPVKEIFSHREDVSLANPFGPAVRGWKKVSNALDFASARFRDGAVTGFETIAEYVGADLATILEVERWKAKVSGREQVSSFELRVTSTFRREAGTWKLVHRHADPIATPHADGPLRSTGGQDVASSPRGETR